MASPPKSVVHINFIAGALLLDPRHIWTALNEAARTGKMPPSLPQELEARLGGTAIHLGTRDYLLCTAVQELKAGILRICEYVPRAQEVNGPPLFRLLNGREVEEVRDRLLLATDSFLYEYRAFLDLFAKFVYGILSGIGKQPQSLQQLSTGERLRLTDRNGRLRTHDCLLYLCDILQVPTDWFMFLSTHRNTFTHGATPYCAIEDRMMFPAEYDVLIMSSNIRDFSVADPKDYFRLSECTDVVAGVRQFGSVVQNYLVNEIRQRSP